MVVTKNRIRFSLCVLVVLNLGLVGIAGAIVLHRQHQSPWYTIAKDMPPESRHHIARMRQHMHRELDIVCDEVEKAKKELENIISAKEFNQEKYEGVLDRLHHARTQIIDKRNDLIGAMMKKLPRKERKILAEKLVDFDSVEQACPLI